MLSLSTLLLILALSLSLSFAIRLLLINVYCAGIGVSTIPSLQPEDARKSKKSFKKALESIGEISPISAREAGVYRDRLNSAGLQIELKTWRGIQIVCICTGVLIAVSLLLQAQDLPHIFFSLLIFLLGLLGPNLMLSSLARDRRKKIEASMPSSLELLSITVRSGYPIERGIRLVSQHTDGPLADEFRAVDADINLLGMSMERALKRMDRRCGTPSVRSFTTALIQASNQGTSISRVLDSQARIARNEHFSALSEQVNKLPAKLVAPIFGIMMLVIVIALAPPIYETVTLFTSAYGDTDIGTTTSLIRG